MQKGAAIEQQNGGALPLAVVASLLDSFERPFLVAERGGKIILANVRAQQCLNLQGLGALISLNLFSDFLRMDPQGVFAQLDSGEHEVYLPVEGLEGVTRARIRWLPEPDWLVVSLEGPPALGNAEDSEMQRKVD